MAFTVKGYGDESYQTPYEDARPLIEAPPIVYHPSYSAFTGEGQPCASVGKAWAIVGRDSITQSGLGWYVGRLNGTTPTLVCVTLYDPWTAAWGTYQAYMHPPEYDGARPGSTTRVSNFRCRFTAVEATT